MHYSLDGSYIMQQVNIPFNSSPSAEPDRKASWLLPDGQPRVGYWLLCAWFMGNLLLLCYMHPTLYYTNHIVWVNTITAYS